METGADRVTIASSEHFFAPLRSRLYMIDFMKIIGRKTIKVEKTSAPKAVKAGAGKTKTSSAASKPASTPTHDEIAKRSYEIYLERGGEHGHAEEDWARAETELLGS
jgi:hypothetical protein